MAIKSVHIQPIPHEDQRMNTVGDYFENSPDNWVILVSETGDWRYNLLVGLHELVELVLTHRDGIDEKDITDFDVEFEKHHEHDDAEPGDDQKAPYHQQHVFAGCLERLMAQRLGVNWEQYEKVITDLWRPKARKHQKHQL